MFSELKNLRLSRGVSACKMAKILGLGTSAAYYKKESGLIRFSLADAQKISNYFGKSIEKIFFDEKVSKKDT